MNITADLNALDKNTLETYEMIAAYTVSLYYNYLYTEAITLKQNKTVSSITEGYKHSIQALINSLENPKFQIKYINGVTEFFNLYGNYEMNTAHCIDRIIKSFIPADYQKAVENKKSSLIREIIIESNKLFIKKLLEQYLTFVIDSREDRDMIRILQTEFIDILCIRRNTIYLRFVNTQLGIHKNPYLDLVYKQKDELKRLYDERFSLKQQITQMKKIIINNNNDRNDKEKLIQELEYKLSVKNDSTLHQMPYHTPTLTRANGYYDTTTSTVDGDRDDESIVIPVATAIDNPVTNVVQIFDEEPDSGSESDSDDAVTASQEIVLSPPQSNAPLPQQQLPDHIQAEIVSQQDKELHKDIQAIEKKADEIFFGDTNYNEWFD